MIWQKEIELPAFSRGYHLITERILDEIKEWPQVGILNVFIKHTSAALTINENFDPAVRVDFESFLTKLIPDDPNLFTHTMEGIDDMPAHIKASFTGSSINVPISDSRPNLGKWQGIYLCEYRNNGGARKIVITIYS